MKKKTEKVRKGKKKKKTTKLRLLKMQTNLSTTYLIKIRKKQVLFK